MTKRWQDGANLLLGFWLLVSPWVMQYTGQELAAWNACVTGTAIVAFAAVAVYMPKAWEEFSNMALGAWLVISPYVLGFAFDTTAAVHTMAVGMLTIGFAAWAMFNDIEFEKWWHEHHFL